MSDLFARRCGETTLELRPCRRILTHGFACPASHRQATTAAAGMMLLPPPMTVGLVPDRLEHRAGEGDDPDVALGVLAHHLVDLSGRHPSWVVQGPTPRVVPVLPHVLDLLVDLGHKDVPPSMSLVRDGDTLHVVTPGGTCQVRPLPALLRDRDGLDPTTLTKLVASDTSTQSLVLRWSNLLDMPPGEVSLFALGVTDSFRLGPDLPGTPGLSWGGPGALPGPSRGHS